MAISKLILNGEVQMDVTSDTVSAGNMLSGITGTKKDGTKATGNIATRTSANLTASGSTVTAAAGYYATSVSKSVAAGSAFPPAVTITKAPTIGVNTSGVVTANYNGSSSITPTVTSGYISQGTAGTISTTGTSTYQLTSQAAATYYPSTADQTIASQRWLVGNQTIKSVTTSNLTAANVAEGVVVKVGDANNASRITQVTGTHRGATTYTATISGSGNSSYCYVTYNGTKYYTDGNTFTFHEGDTLTIYSRGSKVQILGEAVSLSSYTYTYTLPSGNIVINMSYTNYSTNYVYIDIPLISSVIPYYYIYKSLASNSGLTDTTSKVTEWCNSFSYISTRQFEGENFKGTFTFTNVSEVQTGAFARARVWNTGPITYFNLNFPIATSIGSSAFISNFGLTSINGPSVNTIYESTFYECRSLSYVSFPACTLIYSYAFSNCLALTNIDFPLCSKIASGAFAGCTSLTTVSFPVCTHIEAYAFQGCSQLATISFPNCTIVYSQAFSGCKNLLSVNMSKCTQIYPYAFYNCSSLSMINFSSCGFIGSYAFASCTSLTTISFPACQTVGANAFSSCSNLLTVNFPSCTIISDYAFAKCYALTTVNISLCASISDYAFAWCSALEQVNFPQCSIIGRSAFSSCTNLTIASFSTCTSMSMYAFYNCVNLISLYLNNISVVPSISTTTFGSTPISTYITVAGRYGSVYVPSSLYADFLAHSIWKSYSARLVSI